MIATVFDPLAPGIRWDLVIGAAVITLGIALLAFALLRLPNREVREARRLWNALANQAGISRRDRRALLAAARTAGLRSPASMLLSQGCFEHVLGNSGSSSHQAEQPAGEQVVHHAPPAARPGYSARTHVPEPAPRDRDSLSSRTAPRLPAAT